MYFRPTNFKKKNYFKHSIKLNNVTGNKTEKILYFLSSIAKKKHFPQRQLFRSTKYQIKVNFVSAL